MSDIYEFEFQIHSNSLIRVIKNEKGAYMALFVSTITDHKYGIFF